MSVLLKPLAGDWEVVQVMTEGPQESLYRVKHRRNGDLRMLRVLPLDGDAALRLKFQVESQVAAEMGGAVPVEPFEVSISEDRAFVLLQDTGTLDGLQFGWEDELPKSTDELQPYLRARAGEAMEIASGTLRVASASAAEGPFLAAVAEALGERSWIVDRVVTRPIAVDVDFPEGCTEDDLVELSRRDFKIRLGTATEVLRGAPAEAEREIASWTALALYPSGYVRGVSGAFEIGPSETGDEPVLTLIVDDPIALIDPKAELEFPAENGLRASLRVAALRFEA